MFDSVDGLLVVSGFMESIEDGKKGWIGTWVIYELSVLGDWEVLARGREVADFSEKYAAEDAAREIGIHNARLMVRDKEPRTRIEPDV